MLRALELVRDQVFIIDARRGTVVDANAAACDGVAIARSELIGSTWSDIAEQLGRFTLADIDGRWLVAVSSVSPAESDGNRDLLTGLLTREVLLARDVECVGSRIAILFIDLDGFKQVNDTFGHHAGDHVLQVCAQRLKDSVRPGDWVVRYGGDEFVVVVESMTCSRDVDRLARRICKALRQPILVHDHKLLLSASIGIAEHTRGSTGLDELIHAADQAMYQSKLLSHRRGCGSL